MIFGVGCIDFLLFGKGESLCLKCFRLGTKTSPYLLGRFCFVAFEISETGEKSPMFFLKPFFSSTLFRRYQHSAEDQGESRSCVPTTHITRHVPGTKRTELFKDVKQQIKHT